MFPREGMTEKEYFQCERHCILVAGGELVAERMLVPLPRVHEGKFVHGQVRILLANFLDVARMFVPVVSHNSILNFFFMNHNILLVTHCVCYHMQLRISLSVITPTLHPLSVSIFNEVKIYITCITSFHFGLVFSLKRCNGLI